MPQHFEKGSATKANDLILDDIPVELSDLNPLEVHLTSLQILS